MRKTNLLPILIIVLCLACRAPAAAESATAARKVGFLSDARLTECSGIDVSTATGKFLWAVNDGGGGPYLYAIGLDGKPLGRVRVEGARNRDWEAIDTFRWQGAAMILIADVGNNGQHRLPHTLYLVKEPEMTGGTFAPSASVGIVRRIVFTYPDRGHDAEAVTVDASNGEILLLTKRDAPPILFSIPLVAAGDEKQPLAARHVAVLDGIPPPTASDLRYRYGQYRTQPTALDLSPDGRKALVLTYKHAYIIERTPGDSWQTAFGRPLREIPFPLPEAHIDFRQREAACFATDGSALIVTSEGPGSALFVAPLQ